jgi:hypothetical protein
MNMLNRFEDHPQLGRFTLRDEGKTIAIGKITKLIEVRFVPFSPLSCFAEQLLSNINDSERRMVSMFLHCLSLLK